MVETVIQLDWERCLDGYQVQNQAGKEIKLLPKHDDVQEITRPDRGRDSWYLAPRSDRIEKFNPFKKHSAIQRVLAGKLNIRGYLDFADQFGLLTHQLEPEHVSTFLVTAGDMRKMLSYLDCGDTVQLAAHYNDCRWGKNSLYLKADEAGGLSLLHSVTCLRDALWVQFGEMVMRGLNHYRCDECRSWYLPERAKKSNAKHTFCNDKTKNCAIVFGNRERRRRQKEQGDKVK